MTDSTFANYAMTGELRAYKAFQKRICKARAPYKADLTGKVFSRLIALRVADDALDAGRGQRRWWARCLCGNEILVAAKSLMSGNTKSCGCWRKARSTARAAMQERTPDGHFSGPRRGVEKVICPTGTKSTSGNMSGPSSMRYASPILGQGLSLISTLHRDPPAIERGDHLTDRPTP